MKLRSAAFRVALCVMAVLVMAATARADFISGRAWLTTNTNGSNATPAVRDALLLAGPPNVTFTANGINFDSRGGSGDATFFTLGSFLTQGGANNIVGSAAALATALSNGSTTGTIIDFQGTAHFVNGQSFTVAHDDGLTAIVGGLLVINAPSPTSPTTTTATYTGPTGDFAFDLIYGECCSAPAVFKTTLVQSVVPEPASVLLLGTVLVGLAAIKRRRMHRS